MQIDSLESPDALVLVLNGRWDANWADHVAGALEAAIRAGRHRIDVDLAQVPYLSSAGIGVLMKYYGQLKRAGGRLAVRNPQEQVLGVLQLTGVDPLLAGGALPPAAAAAEAPREFERRGCRFEAMRLSVPEPLACQWHGDPSRFAVGRLQADGFQKLPVGPDRFCVGLAAFGSDAADAASRCGEALGLAGVAAVQPTDESHVPDYQIAEAALIPELQILYGVSGRGQFAHLLRFEAGGSDQGTIGLAELAEAVLEETAADAAALALLAESETVVGAALLRSPARAAGASPWDFPAVRDWLAFTSEQNDDRNAVLVAGVVFRQPSSQVRAFLRPFGAGEGTLGHFHAAVFPYRPLPKGLRDLPAAAADLFATGGPSSVLHLLADDRKFEGVGQTELMRGTCWCSPLRDAGVEG